MKTILKIIAILLVASAVAGGFLLAVNGTSTTPSNSAASGRPPVMTSADGQVMTQPMARPAAGEEGGASITRGLAGILLTLIKLAGIAALVWSSEKSFNALGKRKLAPVR